MKIGIKPAARRDLLAIRLWGLETWGKARTADFLEQMIEAVDRLADHPQMGRSRSALRPGLRSIRFRGYAIFYRIDNDRLVIVAVLHERRNHAALDFADQMEGED